LRILIVDRDASFRRDSSLALSAESVDHAFATTYAEATEALARDGESHFDAALVDVGRPASNGFDFLRSLRDAGDETPVVFTSHQESLAESTHALELGADDYLAKPFEFKALVARLRAVVRRALRTPSVRVGRFQVDIVQRHVKVGGRDLDLSPREFEFLWILLQANGRALSRSELSKRLAINGDHANSNVIVVHVSRLRRKLAGMSAAQIETIRGEGYRLTP
jgi:DNA-binding response OmpR family regulator